MKSYIIIYIDIYIPFGKFKSKFEFENSIQKIEIQN
nr:MAG TPA: hypothetical protein [Caudoviricetes sp.]